MAQVTRRAIFRRARRSTVDVKPSRFGQPSRAEFYPIQANPQTSNGKLIFRANLAEEVYIIPRPLLAASDIASISVSDSSSAAVLKKVEMVLTKTGQEKIRSLISSTSSGNPIALVWQNEAHYIYCANKLNGPGSITVADGINANEAKKLQRALKS